MKTHLHDSDVPAIEGDKLRTVVNDWYTINPKFRTKDRLIEMLLAVAGEDWKQGARA